MYIMFDMWWWTNMQLNVGFWPKGLSWNIFCRARSASSDSKMTTESALLSLHSSQGEVEEQTETCL